MLMDLSSVIDRGDAIVTFVTHGPFKVATLGDNKNQDENR